MRWLLVALLATVAVAPLAAQDKNPAKQPKPKRQSNVISQEEIDPIRTEVSTGYDIVQRLRPNFLRGRGPTTLTNTSAGPAAPVPQIILDGAPRGDVDYLKQIPAMTIKEIRYLNASDASIQFGTGYDGGAILVKTR